MNHSTFEIDPTHREVDRRRLVRIPSPFVWTPSEPGYMQIAVVGGTLEQRVHAAMVLRSSGHRVAPQPTADRLVQQLRTRRRVEQRSLQPYALDVVVLHASRDPSATIAALELLRAHAGSIPIVLVADDDAEVLAEAERLCIEGVLAPPVHPVALRAAVAAAVSLPADELVSDSELEVF